MAWGQVASTASRACQMVGSVALSVVVQAVLSGRMVGRHGSPGNVSAARSATLESCGVLIWPYGRSALYKPVRCRSQLVLWVFM